MITEQYLLPIKIPINIITVRQTISINQKRYYVMALFIYTEKALIFYDFQNID